MSRPDLAIRSRRAPLAGLVVILLVLAVLALWSWQRRDVSGPPPLTSFDAEAQSRRIEMTFEDIQATWARLFRDEGRVYTPVEHRFFVRGKPSPCAGTGEVAGPFYCPRDRTMNFDLAFFAALTPQLREVEDPASKLIVAHLAAAAVQDQLGLLGAAEAPLTVALRADCLAGVWAREAAGRLGDVPAGRYELAVQGTRRVTEAGIGRERASVMVLNDLALGDKADREAAFAAGYATGKLGTCLPADRAE